MWGREANRMKSFQQKFIIQLIFLPQRWFIAFHFPWNPRVLFAVLSENSTETSCVTDLGAASYPWRIERWKKETFPINNFRHKYLRGIYKQNFPFSLFFSALDSWINIIFMEKFNDTCTMFTPQSFSIINTCFDVSWERLFLHTTRGAFELDITRLCSGEASELLASIVLVGRATLWRGVLSWRW